MIENGETLDRGQEHADELTRQIGESNVYDMVVVTRHAGHWQAEVTVRNEYFTFSRSARFVMAKSLAYKWREIAGQEATVIFCTQAGLKLADY